MSHIQLPYLAFKRNSVLFILLIFMSGSKNMFAQSASAQQSTMPVFNIRMYGATGNGKTADTKAINAAIDAATAAGGGTVYFPAGIYLSYSIHLKAISLYTSTKDAHCLQPTLPQEEDMTSLNLMKHDKFQDFGHCHWHNSLIWGENLENISI